MESSDPDFDALFNGNDNVCPVCLQPLDICRHDLPPFLRQAFLNAAPPDTPPRQSEWPQDPENFFDERPPARIPTPMHTPRPSQFSSQDEEANALQFEEYKQSFDEDEVTSDATLVQMHTEDYYNPGDRNDPPVLTQPIRPRLTSDPAGFPCTDGGCEDVFDRACDLNRHAKKHLSPSMRPHGCNKCGERFLYPKDVRRHRQTHHTPSSDSDRFYCPELDCTQSFSRRDNLLRHMRVQHPRADQPT